MKKLLFLSLSLLCYGKDLNQILQITYENSPIIKKTKKEIEYLRDDVTLATKFENPKLGFGVNDILLNKPLDRNLEPMQTQSISLSQKFPINSKLNYKESIATQKLEVMELKLIKNKIDLKTNIESILIKISKLNEDLKIVDRYKSIIDESYNLHTIYNLTPQTHYKKAINSKILLTKLKLKENTTKKEIDILKAKLNEIVNNRVGNIPSIKLEIKKIEDLDKLKDEVLKNNIEIVLKSKEIEVLNSKLKFTKSEKIPDLSLNVGYFERDDREDYFSFGVTIPLPIYDRENIKISQNLKEIEIKNSEFLEVKNRISFELNEAYLNLENSKIEVELIGENLNYQNELLNTMLNQVETKSTLTPVYEIVQELLDSEFNLNFKLYEYNLAKIKLDNLKGNL